MKKKNYKAILATVHSAPGMNILQINSQKKSNQFDHLKKKHPLRLIFLKKDQKQKSTKSTKKYQKVQKSTKKYQKVWLLPNSTTCITIALTVTSHFT